MRSIIAPFIPNCTHPPCTTIQGPIALPRYWTGTTSGAQTDTAWTGDFSRGSIGAFHDNKPFNRYARAVRNSCGNGVVDLSEHCDDGNQIDGDGCESDCTLP